MVDFIIIISSFFSKMKSWVAEIVTTFSSIIYLNSRGDYNEIYSFNAISTLFCISSTGLRNKRHFNKKPVDFAYFEGFCELLSLLSNTA